MLPHVVKSVSVDLVVNSLKRNDLTQEHRDHLLLLLKRLIEHGPSSFLMRDRVDALTT
jgi:hypothetical protein